MILYHVTDAVNVEQIARGGFKPVDGDFGKGVYFWDSLEYAQKFLRGGGNWGFQEPVVLEVEISAGDARHVDAGGIVATAMLSEVEPEEEEELVDLWEHTMIVRATRSFKPMSMRVLPPSRRRST